MGRGPEGGPTGERTGRGGGDGRGTSQWLKVIGTHIDAYPGSKRNEYTLVTIENSIPKSSIFTNLLSLPHLLTRRT